MAAASLTSPRKRSTSRISWTGNTRPRAARAVRHPCVFPSASSTQLIANVQIAAGIISLLNDYRLSKGKPALGFLNFWLYGGGLKGLNDITSGSNPGCGTDGFPAIVGWDPVRPARPVSLDFRGWLTLGCIGHGSWDARF